MPRTAQIGALLLIGAAWLGLAPARAQACSGLLCSPSMYFPARGTVPANLPGFYWWPARTGSDIPDWDDAGVWQDDPSTLPTWLRFARVDGSAPEWLEVTLVEPERADGPYLIVPKLPLVAGGTYTLWDVTDCNWTPLTLHTPPTDAELIEREQAEEGWPNSTAHVTVTAAAPLPDMLGSLSASELRTGSVQMPDDAACSGRVEVALVELTLAHAAVAQPWRDVLFYETQLDDGRYAPYGGYHALANRLDYTPGTSFAGRGRDQVYANCGGETYSEGVEPSAHRARIAASIPGTEIALQTNEVSFTLSCPALPDAGADAGLPDAGREPPSGRMDAGVGSDDAGPRSARSDPSERDDGCSVAARSGSELWPHLLALAWLTRRRARRPCAAAGYSPKN